MKIYVDIAESKEGAKLKVMASGESVRTVIIRDGVEKPVMSPVSAEGLINDFESDALAEAERVRDFLESRFFPNKK